MGPLTGLEEIVRLSSEDIIWLQREFYAKKISQEKRCYRRKDTPVAALSEELYVSLGEEHEGLNGTAKRIHNTSESLGPDSWHSCNLL